MKKIRMVIIGMTFMASGYSQTIEQQVEKQVHDPQRKANAGKADAIIANKKNIFDSTTFDNKTAETNSYKTVKASTKRKRCGDKTKQNSRTNASKKKAS